MDIITDLQTRLEVLAVPILTPEERETPIQGRKPGQEGGLSGYLTANPSGYIQLHEPTLVSPGEPEVYLTQLDVLHALNARPLREAVRAILIGNSRSPGPHQLTSLTPLVISGVSAYRISIETGTLAGEV